MRELPRTAPISTIRYRKDAPVYHGGWRNSDVESAVAQFENDGFTVFRGFFSAAEVAEVRQNLRRYQLEIAPHLNSADAFAPPVAKGQYALLARMDHYDPYFAALAADQRFRTLATQLLGGPVRPTHTQYFNIIPGISHPTPPHQDARNFLLKNGEMLNFWLPLTAVNHINGCLHYVPGSHKAGKRYHGPEFGDKGPLIVLDYGDAERAIEVSVHVEPGDLLVHHGFMLHCSEANRSAEERCALGFPYILQKEVRQTVAEWNLGLQH